MVKYIIKHSHYCHGTTISISGYLDRIAQRERKILREPMLIARRNGNYAAIRNNNYISRERYINYLIPRTTMSSTAIRIQTKVTIHSGTKDQCKSYYKILYNNF